LSRKKGNFKEPLATIERRIGMTQRGEVEEDRRPPSIICKLAL